MSSSPYKPLSREADIIVQDLNDEVLVYDLKIHKAFSLNKNSALVWQACDGNKTVSDISNHLSKKLNSSIPEDFVWLALEQLTKENLIENQPATNSQFGGISRREVIRKVGLATMVTLPFITALVAPPSSYAQSGCGGVTNRPNGCSCTSSGGCNSNCCGAIDPVTRVCITQNSEPVGSYCATGCECIGGCCVGSTCQAQGPNGSACQVACQCASGNCSGGVCIGTA